MKGTQNRASNILYFRPKMRGNVENNNPVNIRFVAKISDIRNLFVNLTSDVILKYQKWQHLYQWSRTSGAVSRPPLPNCTFVSSSRVTCRGNAHFFRWLLSLCYITNIWSYFKPFSPLVTAWSIRKCFNHSIRRTKEQKTRLQCLASAMPKPVMPAGAMKRLKLLRRKYERIWQC